MQSLSYLVFYGVFGAIVLALLLLFILQIIIVFRTDFYRALFEKVRQVHATLRPNAIGKDRSKDGSKTREKASSRASSSPIAPSAVAVAVAVVPSSDQATPQAQADTAILPSAPSAAVISPSTSTESAIAAAASSNAVVPASSLSDSRPSDELSAEHESFDSDEKAKSALPLVRFPTVGRMHRVFHWTGFLVSVLQVLRMIDYFAINGIYPAWVIRIWANLTTLVCLCSVSYMTYDFVRMRYVAVLNLVPTYIPTLLFSSATFTTTVVLALCILRAWVNQQWVFGVYYSMYGLDLLFIVGIFDYCVYRLRRKLLELDSIWKEHKNISLQPSPRGSIVEEPVETTAAHSPGNSVDLQATGIGVALAPSVNISRASVGSSEPACQVTPSQFQSVVLHVHPSAADEADATPPLLPNQPRAATRPASRSVPVLKRTKSLMDAVGFGAKMVVRLGSYVRDRANTNTTRARESLAQVLNNTLALAAAASLLGFGVGMYCLIVGVSRIVSDPSNTPSPNDPAKFSSSLTDLLSGLTQLAYTILAAYFSFVPLKFLTRDFSSVKIAAVQAGLLPESHGLFPIA